MKTKVCSISLLLIFIISLNLNLLIQEVKAETFVEGVIAIDTVWTLVDSPFVVSKDVVVSPNVTLFIEPEVEVRFGSTFSLIVEGRLDAVGAFNNLIKFTSNKDDPKEGDWNTIRFKRQILEEFPQLRDRGTIIRYKLVFYKTYEELANAVEELKEGDIGLPLVLYLYKDK